MSTKNPFETTKTNPFAMKDDTLPVANILVKLGDITIASRAIWAEEKSQTKAYNDLNVMAKENPEQLLQILQSNVGKLTFEIRSSELNQGDDLLSIIERA